MNARNDATELKRPHQSVNTRAWRSAHSAGGGAAPDDIAID